MNKHLSASERLIRAQDAKINMLEQMQKEYIALLNYLIRTNGGYYYIDAKKLQQCEPFIAVRAEFTKDENNNPIMELILVKQNGSDNIIFLK